MPVSGADLDKWTAELHDLIRRACQANVSFGVQPDTATRSVYPASDGSFPGLQLQATEVLVRDQWDDDWCVADRKGRAVFLNTYDTCAWTWDADWLDNDTADLTEEPSHG